MSKRCNWINKGILHVKVFCSGAFSFVAVNFHDCHNVWITLATLIVKECYWI